MSLRTVKELKDEIARLEAAGLISDSTELYGYNGSDMERPVSIFPTEYKKDGIDKPEQLMIDVD